MGTGGLHVHNWILIQKVLISLLSSICVQSFPFRHKHRHSPKHKIVRIQKTGCLHFQVWRSSWYTSDEGEAVVWLQRQVARNLANQKQHKERGDKSLSEPRCSLKYEICKMLLSRVKIGNVYEKFTDIWPSYSSAQAPMKCFASWFPNFSVSQFLLTSILPRVMIGQNAWHLPT
jgi:hypothetical protein